jgi:hypothetical protein
MTGAQWHQWTRWVFGSDSLTDAQKLVLLALQTFADCPARTNARPGVAMNRPGMSEDSTSWEGWSHVRWFVEEVPAGAAGAGGADGR